jgi:two-component system, sensor histidine kinase RegB
MKSASTFDLGSAPLISLDGTVRVSLRKLVFIRWVAIAGQLAALLFVYFVLGFELPLGVALAIVAASALFNLIHVWQRQTARLGDLDAAFYLGYDIVQLGLLIYLTGGLGNPFAILMIAPVTIGATILSRRSVVLLSGLALAAITVLATNHLPLPWAGEPPRFPFPYVVGVWTALAFSTVFIAAYTWSIAGGARRINEAFAETQLALAREQRVSAVGALAAAAAHELGSPLATIAVVAKELERELPPDSPFKEDAALLLSQSERCRRILAELAHRPEADGGSPYARLPISALVEAAGAAHRNDSVRVIYATATNVTAGEDEPLVQRSPEILHGLGNLIQNAIQFAQREVTVTVAWDAASISLDIVDDGVGFAPHVLARVGEPYISGRADEGGHMGLGIFIAQTLLERSGAQLEFANLPEGGGHVVIQWNRANLDASDAALLREKGAA